MIITFHVKAKILFRFLSVSKNRYVFHKSKVAYVGFQKAGDTYIHFHKCLLSTMQSTKAKDKIWSALQITKMI